MNKFRRPTTPDEFVRGAATARDLLPQDTTPEETTEASAATPPPPHETEEAHVEPVLMPASDELPQKTSKTRLAKSVPFAAPQVPPELSERVQKQINFDMPETEHWVLKQLVDRTPSMSLRKFYLAAVREKMERMLKNEKASDARRTS